MHLSGSPLTKVSGFFGTMRDRSGSLKKGWTWLEQGSVVVVPCKRPCCSCFRDPLFQWIMTEVGETERPGDDKPWVPERVKKALEGAADFGEFRGKREFTFLHLFAGKKDVLGEEICRAASEKGLVATVTFVDKEHDGSDLSEEEPFKTIVADVEGGEFDGVHAGFPCGSFSMVRWNQKENMPGPVRSGEFIYGLPTNTKTQQAEADRGTLLAGRSVVVVDKQLQSAKVRRVPGIGTLENPPGTEEKGSAWALPEIKSFMKKWAGVEANFNTCAFQEGKFRWKKPARFGGRLAGLKDLSRVCKCPGWVTHESLTGKEKTSKAAQYPTALAKAYAELVVNLWKKQLQLEWWRQREDLTTAEVGHLKAAEKKRKREEPSPVKVLEDEPSSSVTVKPNDESRPRTRTPTAKEIREAENRNAIGGMRNPKRSVRRLSGLLEVGADLREDWRSLVEDFPGVMETARKYGTKKCELIPEALEEWKKHLREYLEVKEAAGFMVKENWEFRSPLDADLWDGWHKTTNDPENCIGMWAREGAPLGMEVPIPTCGIYPTVEVDETDYEDLPELENIQAKRNYASMYEMQEEATVEINRYVEKGFAVVKPVEWAQSVFGTGTVSKLACIHKVRDDGTSKTRIIVDLLRSDGNRRARIPERVILPRASDVCDMVRDLHAESRDYKRSLGRLQSEDEASWEMEILMVDLADAFCHFPLRKEELRHALATGLQENQIICFTAMLFGFRGAPLVMGRLSAALARMWQALLAPGQGALQLYVDDALVVLQGPKRLRDEALGLLLYTAAAFGVQVAFHKGERGLRTVWIGVQFELDLAKKMLLLAIPKKMVEEIEKAVKDWKKRGMIPLKELRSITGKVSWLAGVLGRWRWTANIMYAVIADQLRDLHENKEEDRAKKRKDTRTKAHLVAVSRVELARTWLVRAVENPTLFLVRQEPWVLPDATWGIISDACPFGIGAILVVYDGTKFVITKALQGEITMQEARLLNVPYGLSDSQGPLEAYALLRAMKTWASQLRQRTFFIKSDSIVALAVARKLSSCSPVLNYVGAEMGLLLDHIQCSRVQMAHLPGKLNIEADWLSRGHERNEDQRPASLEGVTIRKIPSIEDEEKALLPMPWHTSLWGKATADVSPLFDKLFG